MPTLTTVAELLDLTKKSGVADEARLASCLERGTADGSLPSDPVAMADLLVRDAVITRFQADQLLQGKWRRFTLGKYKVLELIGSGGMGSVFLCEHKLMRRQVAIKVLPTSAAKDESALERFYREARAVAALDHPNIVRAHDIDRDGELHFLVMEYVDGASLHEIVTRGGALTPLRAAHYVRQAALGLQHLHEAAAIVHRDIKPGNILVDRTGCVKILDMGLVRFFQVESDALAEKRDENILGTADYLAPEQALDSRNVSIQADIYSLGATFYYCLTGKTPFPDGTVAQKLIWHQTRQPKPITTYRQDIPAGLLAILNRMMAKDVAQRYALPREVADALAEWTATPIPPPPEVEMPQLSPAARKSVDSAGGRSPATKATPAPPPGGRIPWKTISSSSPTSLPAQPMSAGAPAAIAPATKPLPRIQPKLAPAARPAQTAKPAELSMPETSSVDVGTLPRPEALSPTDASLARADTAPTPPARRPAAKRKKSGPLANPAPAKGLDVALGLGLGIGAVVAAAVGLAWWLLRRGG